MSAFNLNESMARFASHSEGLTARLRTDRGRSRLDPRLHEELARELLVQERPSISELLERLRRFAREHGIRPPARATLYELMDNLEVPDYAVAELPEAVRATLHNIDPEGRIPGPQLVFHCFSYGTLAAVSWAAALPWLTLRQASRRRGWRGPSRGLLESVLLARGI
jgi:hypothetical protein